MLFICLERSADAVNDVIVFADTFVNFRLLGIALAHPIGEAM